MKPFPLSLTLAFLTFVIDQVHKWWMIHVYKIADKDQVNILPFFDLILVWNRGISYGMFQMDSDLGRYFLFAFKFIAGIGLLVWGFKNTSRLQAVAIGLVAGGAFANAVDRIHYGAVADFFLFKIPQWDFYWYVFNIADVAIVFGVILLLYHSYTEEKQTP
jgi:signal peptidase II